MITSEELDYLRGISVQNLLQTYTRTPMTLSSANPHGEKTRTPGTPVSAVPCYFKPEGSTKMTDMGPVVLLEPVLYIRHSDTLAVGDQVSNVLDEKAILVAAGPFKVKSRRASGGLLWALQECELERLALGART